MHVRKGAALDLGREDGKDRAQDAALKRGATHEPVCDSRRRLQEAGGSGLEEGARAAAGNPGGNAAGLCL